MSTLSVVVCCFIAFVFGIVVGVPIALRFSRAGSLVIDQTDPKTDKYSFELETGLNKLPEQNYISLKIKVIKDPQQIQSL